MNGILYPKGRRAVITNYDADIETVGGVERIFARASGHNRADFTDGTGKMLFRCHPANGGGLNALKNVDFFRESDRIAQIRYSGLLGPPTFHLDSSMLGIEVATEEQAEVYKGDGIQWIVPLNKVTATFTVSDQALLFPCIGFVYYCWTIRWGTA